MESWHLERMFTPRHVSHVTCHVSGVRCHAPCGFLLLLFILQSGGASLWRVYYQQSLPRIVFLLTAPKCFPFYITFFEAILSLWNLFSMIWISGQRLILFRIHLGWSLSKTLPLRGRVFYTCWLRLTNCPAFFRDTTIIFFVCELNSQFPRLDPNSTARHFCMPG